MDVGLASIIRRSGSYPGSICTATLKNNHGHNAGARFSWMLWKTKTVPWQRMFPPGTRGKKEVALFLNDKMQCTATFWVDTKTCSIKDDHCHQSYVLLSSAYNNASLTIRLSFQTIDMREIKAYFPAVSYGGGRNAD
ncbi:hypothetical protein PtB15_12B346 [Puccinia triticina]|nr:hypothetical protein PtB15_12B346 [Puccinia triticina]